jgi:hypothetical protein
MDSGNGKTQERSGLDPKDRAKEQDRREGQRLQDPPLRIQHLSVWDKYPDLAAEHERLYDELHRRSAENPYARRFPPGCFSWNTADFPEIAEALERLEDELERREGVVRPVIRVKVGDTVIANGRRWTVTDVYARQNVAYLEWHEGTTSSSVPAVADKLVPEE